MHSSDHGYRTVNPTQPVAGYVGGKRQLARRIIAAIEAVPHGLYAEPFVGMGGVFLRRTSAPRAEAINDMSRDVAGLFRILQRHYQAFMDTLKWQITSRADFERLVATDPETLTDLERAARFLYLQRLSFGGKVVGRTFGISTNGPARFDITKLGSMLEAVHDRLAGVVVDCLPWEKFIARWDRPHTLFYVDPPYWGTEHYYGRGMFEPADHERLAAALKSLQGRFILSLNDCQEVRDLYAWASIQEEGLTYTMAGNGKALKVGELIISGGAGV